VNPIPTDGFRVGQHTAQASHALSEPLARKIAPPDDVLVEHAGDGGLLMIAAEEKFDTANPSHMAAARSILRSVQSLNDEFEREAADWP
jgi:hypothetical protein